MKREQLKEIATRKGLKVWESGEKLRVYIQRNKREQAGYVTFDSKDVKNYNPQSDEHMGLFLCPTRPGNQSTLFSAIEEIVSEIKEEISEVIENNSKVSKVILKSSEIVELGNEPTGFFYDGFFYSYDNIIKIPQDEVIEWFDELGISSKY